MIRIAFSLIGGKNWTGGYNYLINLLNVLDNYCPNKVKPVLFISEDIGAEDILPFRKLKSVCIVITPIFNKERKKLSLLKSLILGVDDSIKNLFSEHKIDVVFENAQFYGRRLNIPVIAWIPDFQHIFLPQLFTFYSWWKRELGFRAQISSNRLIMLSSFDAEAACKRYYPKSLGRTHVVRFAINSMTLPSTEEVNKVRSIYDLPLRYFYLPNQFWQHKNHFLVVDALKLALKSEVEIYIVSSGKQFDPNRPKYFIKFKKHLESSGVADHFKLLGMIPYEHIPVLMRGSVAVINPSLFEGWSTTVEEARLLNVDLLLSDIPVHIEQADAIANFFEHSSPASLSKALIDLLAESNSRSNINFKQSINTQELLEKFASDFINLVEFAFITIKSDNKKDL